MNQYGNNGYGGGFGGSPLSQRGRLIPPGTPGLGNPLPPPVARALNPGLGSIPDMSNGAVTRRHFDVDRVIQAGGRLLTEILPESLIPWEQLYRRQPEEGMFDPSISPSNPFTFELGAFEVPNRMALLIFDLRPDIYRFSGVDPGDYVPVESRRFGSILGFDVTVDQKRQGQMSFELDPVPIQRSSQQAFTSNNEEAPQFNTSQRAVAQSSSFANSAGMGNALLPQRPTRYGALSIPFTIYAKSRQVVQVRCVIFRPMPTPIAFIEYDVAGLLVPETWFGNMTQAVQSPQNQADEALR